MRQQTKYIWAGSDSVNEAASLTVKAIDWNDATMGKNVLLQQSAQSVSFQFHMSPEQARQMAMALIAAAESLA